MRTLRLFLTFLVSLALAWPGAPAALASSLGHAKAETTAMSPKASAQTSTEDMEDCHGKHVASQSGQSSAAVEPAAAADDGKKCPCCEPGAKCLASLCAIKCMKVLSGGELLRTLDGVLAGRLSPPPSTLAAGLAERPPAPPPRA